MEDMYDVLAYTEDYQMVVVETEEGLCYAIMNSNTGVFEYQGNIFSNTVNKLEELQTAYYSAMAVLQEDGRLDIDGEGLIKMMKEDLH